MKIAITTQGHSAEDPVDERFGRSSGFMVYDSETKQYSYLDNQQGVNAMQGAGVQAAQSMVNAGVGAVITGHCGPKAFRALDAAKIEVYIGAGGTIAEAIEAYRAGSLTKAASADVGGHW